MKLTRLAYLVRSETIAFFLAACALVLGFIGWAEAYDWHLVDKLPEILVRVMRLYIPGSAVIDSGNALTRIAAVLGTLSAISGLLIWWLSVTGRSIDNGWTRLLRKDHSLILGNTDFAMTIDGILRDRGARPIRVTAKADAPTGRTVIPGLLPLGFDTRVLVTKAGTLRAAHIVIDLGSDIDTLDLARRLIEAADNNPRSRVTSVAIRVADGLLGLKFVELVAAERRAAARMRALARLSIFDQHAIAARHLLEQVPLFARAAARAQQRVHVLIVGFGDSGEKMLDQVFLTSVAGDLDVPRVTVVDGNADQLKRQFDARRPGVTETLAIEFVTLDVLAEPLAGTDPAAGAIRLQAIEADCAFTAILLAGGVDARNVRAAVVLAAHQARNGLCRAPILGCLLGETAVATTLFPDAPAALAADTGCAFISLPTDALKRAALGDPDSHGLARALHEAYRAGNSTSSAADQPWDALSETLRQSNVRAADHVPAMLWSAGLMDVSGLALAHDAIDVLAQVLAQIETAPANAAVLRLARIEHDRWCIDRKLDGWRHAVVRNDLRRQHPLIVPFDALADRPDEIAKDLEHVAIVLRHGVAVRR